MPPSKAILFWRTRVRIMKILILTGKNIVVGSLFLTTGDTAYISRTVIDGQNNEAVVTFSSGENGASVLTGFSITNGRSDEGGGIKCKNNSNPSLSNLRIYGNAAYAGGAIYCSSSSPSLRSLTLYKNAAQNYGGAIYCNNSNPTLDHVTIFENDASWGGGGIFCIYRSSPILQNVTLSGNTAKYWAGAVYSEESSNPRLTNAILWNNSPHEIRLLYGEITVGYSDVKGGRSEIRNDTSSWLNAGKVTWLEGNIDDNPLFCGPSGGLLTLAENSPCLGTGENGANMGGQDVGCGPMNPDESPSVLRVSKDGSDESGDGSRDHPLATIQHALDLCAPGDTILVYPGTYVENIRLNKRGIVLGSLFLTTGDPSYINGTIIDGGAGGSVISISNGDTATTIKGFTLTNGKADEGGGIYCFDSSPTLSDLRLMHNSSGMGGGLSASSSKFRLVNTVIADNESSDFGGGVFVSDSSPVLSDVVVKDNHAGGSGGGCIFYSSGPRLENVTVRGNTACYNGGGIALHFSSAVFDSIRRCNIYMNHAGRGSDIEYFTLDEGNAGFTVFADTFTVKNPTDFHVYRIDRFSILNGKLNQSNADLYVSPAGTADNSGESPSEPLGAISHALSKIRADRMNPRTIHIFEGVYGPSQPGEFFPLNMVDYVSLKGENGGKVVLDAGETSGVISFDSDMGITVENLCITGGFRFEGGGVFCENSSPIFRNDVIAENKAMSSGGGILFSENCQPDFINCTISGNEAALGGGIAFYLSCADLLNTILWGNSPDEIYFHGTNSLRSCVKFSYTDVMTGKDKIRTNNHGDVYWYEGNLNSDPLFCDSGGRVYLLAEDSPCIGTGKNGANMGALGVGCGPMAVPAKPAVSSGGFKIHWNYPNPFNPSTQIEYEIPRSGDVEVDIYDVRGRLIRSFEKSQQQAGIHRLAWDGRGDNSIAAASGVYFWRVHFNGQLLSRKITFIR